MNLKCSSVDGGERTLGNCGPGGRSNKGTKKEEAQEGGNLFWGLRILFGGRGILPDNSETPKQRETEMKNKNSSFRCDSLLFVAWARRWRGRLFAVKNFIVQGRMENKFVFAKILCLRSKSMQRLNCNLLYTFSSSLSLLNHSICAL